MSASQPVFSVIIATHNRKAMLECAIQSVLDQTFTDFEILVVDNGSTDGTRSAVEAIGDSRLRYVSNPRPTASCDVPRNIGIEAAEGRYIAFLDDDDIWYSDKLEKVKKAFDEHPDAACVCHDENRRSNAVYDGVLRYGPWSEDIYERLLYDGNLFSSCATTIKAETLRRFKGFDERDDLSEIADYDLWIRMAKEDVKTFFMPEILGEFRLTGSNWSVVNPKFSAKQVSMIAGYILEYEGRPLFRISKRGHRRLLQLHAIAGRSFFINRYYADALRHFGLAIIFIAIRPTLLANLLKKVKEEIHETGMLPGRIR